MPKRSSKPKGDANVIGFMVAQIATSTKTGETEAGDQGVPAGSSRSAGRAGGPGTASGGGEPSQAQDQGKNPAAVALGRLGGLKGGKARAEKLSAKKRAQIAKKAAEARWSAKKKTT